MTTTCKRCGGVRWMCEAHPDKPHEHDGCREAGVPCPICNTGNPPRLPREPTDR